MTPSSRRALLRLTGIAATLIVIRWALMGTEFDLRQFEGAGENAARFFRGLFPPDWSEMGPALSALVVTFQMALLGTVFGVVVALPVSFLAARTMVLPRWFSSGVKQILNVLRAIPAQIYAILFVWIVGLGPFTGAMGIAVGSFAFLGKLFAESLESVHPAPIEGVRAVGANPVQVFAYAMLPQALPQFISHTLYAFEHNLVSATVVGIVGAGGIGFRLLQTINYNQWEKTAVYVLLLITLVLIVDAASYQIRRRVT
jgi:phosphonate transport system permease protein